MVRPPFTFARNTLGSNGSFCLLFIADPPYRERCPHARRSLRGFTRRQYQTHDSSFAVAHPFDVAAELSRKGIDQAAAKPGIRALRIGPLPVVGDSQAKLSRKTLQRHSDCCLLYTSPSPRDR